MAEIGIQILVTGSGVARANLGAFESDLRRVQTEINTTADKSNFLTTRLLNLGNSMSQIGASVLGMGRTLSIGLTAPIIAFGASAVSAGIEFESAFAGVAKTVDGVADSTGRLTDMGREMQSALLTMGMDFATPVNDLAKIAEIGGQLRVPADSLLEFTKIIAQTVIATDLSAQDAAFNVARIGNIYGVAAEDITGFADHFTNALVFLGNTSAATEGEITATVTRIASSARQLGISAADTLGIAATIAGIGARPELGGTAVQRIFLELLDAATAAVDSDKVQQFAAILGVTGEEFQNLVKTNPTEAFTRVLKSLSSMQQAGGNMRDVLEGVDLTGIRLIDVIGRLTGATGVLERNLIGANEAWNNGTARQEEFNKRSITLESSIIELKNAFTALGFTLEKLLGPTLVFIIESIKNVIRAFIALPESVQRTIIGFALAAAAIGPLLVAIGGIIGIAGAAVSAIAAYGGAVLGLIPILIPVITLAAAFVAGIMQIVNSNADIQETSDAFSTFGRQVEISGETIQNVLANIANNPFIKAMKEFVQGIANTVQERWPEIEEAFYRLSTAINEFFLVLQHNIGPIFANMFNTESGQNIADFIIDVLIWAIDQLAIAVHNLASFLESPLGQTIFDVLETITGNLPGLIDAVKTKAQEFFDNVVNSPVAQGVFSVISDIMTELPDKIKKVSDKFREMFDLVKRVFEVAFGPQGGGVPEILDSTDLAAGAAGVVSPEQAQDSSILQKVLEIRYAIQGIINKFGEWRDKVIGIKDEILKRFEEIQKGFLESFNINKITEKFPLLQESFTKLKDALINEFNAIRDNFKPLAEAVDKFIDNLKIPFAEIGGGIGKFIELLATSALDGAVKLFEAITRFIENDKGTENIKSLLELFRIIGKQVQESGKLGELGAAFERLGAAFSVLLEVAKPLGEVFDAMFRFLASFAGFTVSEDAGIMEFLKGNAGDGAITVIDALIYLIDEFTRKLLELAAGIDTLTTKFDELGVGFDEIATAIDTSNQNWQDYKTNVSNTVSSFVSETLANFTEMRTGVETDTNEMTTNVGASFADMNTKASASAGAMAIGIPASFQQMIANSLSAIATLTTGAVNLFNWLYTELVGSSIVPDMVNEILRWFNMLSMNNPMSQFADNFISEARNLYNQIAPIMANIASTVANALSALSGGNINIPSMGSFSSSSTSKSSVAPSSSTLKASSIASVKPASSASYSSTSSKSTTLNVKTVPVKNEQEFGRVANKILNTLAY